jgi:outer membrane protein OmpA-like peptidoglycan-associated protein
MERARWWTILALVIVSWLGSSSHLFADEHLRGVITEHCNDGTIAVQVDAASIIVVFSDTTKLVRLDGARISEAESAALIPGLLVQLRGDYESPTRFIAQRVSFTRTDLKTAQAINAGVMATTLRSLDNQARIQQEADMLGQQQQTLDQHGQAIRTNERNIIGTAGAIEATNRRISNLDNYDVISTVTVYFANGKSTIAPKYKEQLQQLAARLKGSPEYLVQVQGFASAVGPTELNQHLSEDRADEVVSLLQQSGVPLTSIVVPAAMGTTQQVASNTTNKGQAENRRTVVTLLKNKGVAGLN